MVAKIKKRREKTIMKTNRSESMSNPPTRKIIEIRVSTKKTKNIGTKTDAILRKREGFSKSRAG